MEPQVMKNGIQKQSNFNDGTNMVNVFDLKTKEVVYCGILTDVAKFLGVPEKYAGFYLKTKYRFHKKYALRIKSEK